MIKEIKQFFVRTWEGIKNQARRFKKWIWGALGLGGTIVLASVLLGTPAIPSVEVNGVVIEFPYTDENSDENVLIYTDRETYSNGEYIHMAIKNEGADGTANIQFFFSESDRHITEIKRLVKNSPYQVGIPEYKTAKYDCSYTLPATATTSNPEQFIEKTCEKEYITGIHSETRYKDIWVNELITDFSKVENDLLISKITEKPKDEYTALEKTEVELVDSFTYFRAKIKSPMKIDEEFFIEIIGDELYGHLDPFLSGFNKRIQFDISSTNIDASLTHFPVLLTLGTSVGNNSADVSAVFDELGSDANRKKIAVTTSDEETQIYVEIEKWDDGNEQAWLWVSATGTVISNSATTTLYLYYDSTHADNDTYVGDTNDVPAEGVWDSSYIGVYHLADDDTNTSVYDSTSNDTDGTKKANAEPTQSTAGKIGNCQDFDGSNDNISFGVDVFGLGANDFTITSWAYLNVDQNANIIGNYDPGVDPAFYNLQYRSGVNGYEFYTRDSNADANNTVTNVTTRDAWIMVSAVNVGTNFNIWTNTTEKAQVQGQVVDSVENGSDNRIGYRPDDSWPWADKLDEIRVSTTARADAWIKAGYYSQEDNLISWGAEEAPAAAEVVEPAAIIIFD